MNAIILVKRLGHKLTINEEDRPMTIIRNVCLITISFIGLAFTSYQRVQVAMKQSITLQGAIR